MQCGSRRRSGSLAPSRRRAFEEGAVHAVAGGRGYGRRSRPASIPTMMELVNQNIVDMAMFVDGTNSNGQGSLSAPGPSPAGSRCPCRGTSPRREALPLALFGIFG